MADSKTRPLAKADLPAIRKLIDSTGLFKAKQLDAMVADYLENKEGADQWVTCDQGGPVGVACYGAEPRAQGTWNLHLVAVRSDRQGAGIGTSLLQHIETTLTEQGERILFIEISSYDQYQRTRNHCRKCGFHEEARLREFYKRGEDKLIFRKTLSGA